MTTPKKTIGQVAKLAGITPYVIRAWEKRYQFTNPARTDTNRRLYDEADVTKLCLLATLTASGYSIGQLTSYSIDQLQELVSGLGGQPARKDSGNDTLDDLFSQAMRCVEDMDNSGFQALLHKANMTFTKPVLIGSFLTPLLHKVGELWETGELRVAHEHMCAATVRSFLATLLMNQSLPAGARTLVACTPQGQEHEIGALSAALTAKLNGWDVCYLGSDLPAEEVAASAVQSGAAGVLLSISYPTPDIVQFQILRNVLPDLPLFVGGRVVDHLREPLTDLGYTIVDSLDQLPGELSAIR